ncbi:hypothetical protein B0H16DRAFT_1464162 [Mycena metata]|uniref:Uncharacterized protein n=1 Tax=Mycena metata TaxID=1033252 RepID=A0AAD7N1H5_9AGAR|nr:hypothetical protein B0H16DRAFT_1464162 [Mycena metata]
MVGIPTVPYTVTVVKITGLYGQRSARNRHRKEFFRGSYVYGHYDRKSILDAKENSNSFLLSPKYLRQFCLKPDAQYARATNILHHTKRYTQETDIRRREESNLLLPLTRLAYLARKLHRGRATTTVHGGSSITVRGLTAAHIWQVRPTTLELPRSFDRINLCLGLKIGKKKPVEVRTGILASCGVQKRKIGDKLYRREESNLRLPLVRPDSSQNIIRGRPPRPFKRNSTFSFVEKKMLFSEYGRMQLGGIEPPPPSLRLTKCSWREGDHHKKGKPPIHAAGKLASIAKRCFNLIRSKSRTDFNPRPKHLKQDSFEVDAPARKGSNNGTPLWKYVPESSHPAGCKKLFGENYTAGRNRTSDSLLQSLGRKRRRATTAVYDGLNMHERRLMTGSAHPARCKKIILGQAAPLGGIKPPPPSYTQILDIISWGGRPPRSTTAWTCMKEAS